MQLKEKVAVVTGASRGIGRAIALRLARDGALVGVHYSSSEAAATAVVREIEESGGSAFLLKADVSSVPQIKQMYDSLDAELTKRTGTAQFDILVNNSGVAPAATVDETTEETFDQVISVNLKGAFFVTQQALPRLRDGGRIINISSVVARTPIPEVAVYCMSKGAINTFTLLLAGQLGKRGITVNTLAPGWTATDMNADVLADPEMRQQISSLTTLGRIGSVDDIASVAAFLASPDSGWVTGQYIEASGGFKL